MRTEVQVQNLLSLAGEFGTEKDWDGSYSAAKKALDLARSKTLQFGAYPVLSLKMLAQASMNLSCPSLAVTHIEELLGLLPDVYEEELELLDEGGIHELAGHVYLRLARLWADEGHRFNERHYLANASQQYCKAIAYINDDQQANRLADIVVALSVRPRGTVRKVRKMLVDHQMGGGAYLRLARQSADHGNRADERHFLREASQEYREELELTNDYERANHLADVLVAMSVRPRGTVRGVRQTLARNLSRQDIAVQRMHMQSMAE